MDGFVNSLLLMAYGMLGLFATMGAIYAGVAAMRAVFARKKKDASRAKQFGQRRRGNLPRRFSYGGGR